MLLCEQNALSVAFHGDLRIKSGAPCPGGLRGPHGFLRQRLLALDEDEGATDQLLECVLVRSSQWRSMVQVAPAEVHSLGVVSAKLHSVEPAHVSLPTKRGRRSIEFHALGSLVSEEVKAEDEIWHEIVAKAVPHPNGQG